MRKMSEKIQNLRPVKVIKQAAQQQSERRRAEAGLMAIYVRVMAAEYPETLKKVLKEIKMELC